MHNILVTGGAGYIGSHIVRDLTERKYNVIVLDNLCEGHREAVNNSRLYTADLKDFPSLENIFTNNKIDAVLHFAAFAYVGESVVNPEKYYYNNVAASLNLLSAMQKFNVKKLIFSSSCASYGVPVYTPIDENHPQNPVNPYGATKLMTERMISDFNRAYGLQFIALRYFNAAGAHPDGSIGESHKNETHLIPLILKTLTGEKKEIEIFGNDYETHDGTCVRDYIHVCDLAAAHRIALEMVFSGETGKFINLGNGKGFSVKEIISLCEEICKKKVSCKTSARRPGDPPFLISGSIYKNDSFNFSPKYDIHEIIKTAWNWEQNRKY